MGLLTRQFQILFLAISAFFVFLALRGAKNQLDEKVAPLAGLAAVFIFAMQMINFPVAAGTSGHLIGGALAAILDWTMGRRARSNCSSNCAGTSFCRWRINRNRIKHF
jgi:hypothetical protein